MTEGRVSLSTLAAAAAVAVAGLAVPSTALAAPPANDNFANAQTNFDLGEASITATGTNVEATKEPGEPDHAGNAGGASVWFAAPEADFNGTVTVGTCGTDFDTLLGIYTGSSVNALTEIASNDNSCGQQSQVTFDFVDGATYYAAVDGAGGAMGNLKLTLTFGSTPPGGGGPVANDISFGDLKRNKEKGTAKLTVNVPGAGSLALAGKDLKPASAQAQGAGDVTLPVKAKSDAKAKLNDKGKAKVRPKITFTPTGGTPNTERTTVKLVKR